jgi:S1-C subfamily serine protease
VRGDLLDIFLVVLCIGSGFAGYRQGFLVGALSFVGVVGGGILGTKLAVPIIDWVGGDVPPPALGLIVVFAMASIGQVLAATLGTMLRSRVHFEPAQLVDSVGGAALSVVSVLLVAWLVATSISHSSLTGLTRQIRRSAVIAAVDAVIPVGLRNTLTNFRQLLDNTGFPAIVNPLTTEQAPAVQAPDPAVAQSTAVRVASASILKVTGTANSCSRSVEGSGFVYATDRVVTNAHVVAGVKSPRVHVGNRLLRATVVVYDPNRDVAVLAVPNLGITPLAFAGVAAQGQSSVVAGYPEDGPFTAVAARVRDRLTIAGPNIYQNHQVRREVYAIRAEVRPGNSGGPLLAPDGRVYGVVFAASTDAADTGYALTAAEVAPDVAAGTNATASVSTGSCD